MDTPHPEPPPVPPSLARVGDFTIVREIGRGGMGVVYEATQSGVERRVALKVLPASLGSDAVSRFEREAKSAGSLKHPGIVPVFALGEDHGLHYIAMEYVEGPTLDTLIEDLVERARAGGDSPRPQVGGEAAQTRGGRGRDERAGEARGTAATPAPSSPAPGDPIRVARPDSRRFHLRVAELFAGTARALAAAHFSGVIHRDIKPSNLILDPAGSLRVLDFGLARAQDMGRITHTGETIGTPRYLAPEAIDSKAAEPDHRSDVYSLGVTLYETLTRRPAFNGDSTEEILLEVLHHEPPRPRTVNPSLPRDLETIVLRATAKRPGDRYPDAAAFAEDLERFAQGLAPRARRLGPVTRSFRWVGRHKPVVAVAALLLVVFVLLAFLVSRDAEDRRAEEIKLAMAQGHHYLSAGADADGDDSEELAPTDKTRLARDRFSRVTELDPGRAEAWFYRAICALELGDDGSARADLRAALKADASFAAARVLLADMLRREGRSDEAEALLAKMSVADDAAPRPEALYYEGRALLYARAPAEAYRRFDAALAANLSDPYLKYRAYLGRGDAAVTLGDRVQALEDYSAARTLRGETTEVMLKLARLHFLEGRDAKGNACLAAAAPEEEKKPAPFIMVAEMLESIGRPADALRWMNEAIRRAPDDPAPLAQRAEILLRVGRPTAALQTANRALGFDGEHVRAAEARARALLRLNKTAEAVQTLSEARRSAPTDLRVNRWLARAHARQGDHRAALKASERALRLAPRDIDARVLYTENLFNAGARDEAMREIQKTLRQEKARFRPFVKLGVESVRRGTPAPRPGSLPPGRTDGRVRTASATKKGTPPTPRAEYSTGRPPPGLAGQDRAKSADPRAERRGRRKNVRIIRQIVKHAERAKSTGSFDQRLATTAFLAALGARRAPEFAIELGRTARGKAQHAQAAETIRMAYEKFPQHAELAFRLGVSRYRSDDATGFERLLAELAASKRASLLGTRARLLAVGKRPEARAAFDAARAAGWRGSAKRYPELRTVDAEAAKPEK